MECERMEVWSAPIVPLRLGSSVFASVGLASVFVSGGLVSVFASGGLVSVFVSGGLVSVFAFGILVLVSIMGSVFVSGLISCLGSDDVSSARVIGMIVGWRGEEAGGGGWG
jgi:hypothetical protein